MSYMCRNRMGKGATGPITYLAQAKGFKCVKVSPKFLSLMKESQLRLKHCRIIWNR